MKGFIPHYNDGSNRPQALEYLPAGAITPKKGLARKWDGGQLELLSGGTTKPEYICMCEKSAAVTAGTIIPVLKVNPDMVFETELSVDGDSSAPKLGTLQTIASDGLRVTKTTTNGTARVVGLIATDSNGYGAAGDTVYVRFN